CRSRDPQQVGRGFRRRRAHRAGAAARPWCTGRVAAGRCPQRRLAADARPAPVAGGVMDPASLPLRDIHPPLPPPLWPPAPGWWLLGLAVVAAVLGAWWWRRRRARRRAAITAVFDEAVAAAGTPDEQLAAMSELLRRAARRIDPRADRLDGAAWLEFLDRHDPGSAESGTGMAFSSGPGRVLLTGPWRRDVGGEEVERLRPLARTWFLAQMDG